MSMRLLALAAMSLVLLLAATLSGPATGKAKAGRLAPSGDDRQTVTPKSNITQGSLCVNAAGGKVVECPLKKTEVRAEVSGFIARVNVTQVFHNPFDEKIEAVYVFPLPHEAAVDGMTMVIGERRIVGLIKKRAEARKIYEKAIQEGQTASLLEQERPNIFTQSVGNIPPGQEIRIEISYVDVLSYDQGVYEFHFPMVVGPRYNPSGYKDGIGAVPLGKEGTSGQPVEVAYLKPGERNGHDISLSVDLDAGVPIQDLKVLNHWTDVLRAGDTQATVTLSSDDRIPNKDFVLRYAVVGKRPEMATLFHANGDQQGYFMLMVQPREDERLREAPPREMVFLADVSGSMSGIPMAKSREAMEQALNLCRAQDTVQVITFAGGAKRLFEKALPCTKANIQRALNFTQQLEGGGGTEMLKGVQAAIDDPLEKDRVRFVVMLTDGYIGNEKEIIEYVGGHCGDRVRFWVLGIGSSVNRFLVDGVAKQGGGMGKVIGLNEPAIATVQEMILRIQRAQLAKPKLTCEGIELREMFPSRIPELWAGRPIILFGQYTGSGTATLTLSGEVEGEPAKWPLKVSFPAKEPEHDVLSTVWARKKIEDLNENDRYRETSSVVEEITQLALKHKLTSRYTSFVAVEKKPLVEPDGVAPKRVGVPVPMPDGVSYKGNFGEDPANLPASSEPAPRSIQMTVSPTLPPVEHPVVMHEEVEVADQNETADDMDNMTAKGDREDAISAVPLGGAGLSAAIGLGGGGGGSFGQRNGGGRRRLVVCGGGSKATESFGDTALYWMAQNQEADGHWDARKHGATAQNDIAVTGLALLSFLGAGHTEKVGQHKDNVRRAVAWLKSKQNTDGLIVDGDQPSGLLNPHAIAGTALAEAAGMVGMPDTKAAAQKAVDCSIKQLQRVDGGFAKNAKSPDGDLFTTIWFVMQLKSSKVAGLNVDYASFEKLIKFLDRVERKGAGGDVGFGPASIYSNRPGEEQAEGAHSLTAIGTVTRQLLGWKREDLQPSAHWFVQKGGLPDAWKEEKVDLLYWYFGTLCAFQQGGETWKQWNEAMKKTFCDAQRQDGTEKGSLDPIGAGAREWGRVGQTALVCLCLEVYYRYLPLYR